MSWLTDIVSGGGDLFNTAISWGLNTMGSKWESDEEYEKNRRLQKHNFEFQREMFQKQLDADNTAIQRRMADADAAGLNANLLFGAGSQGAGTPSAGGGSSASVSVDSPKADLMTAVGIAMQKERQDAELDALEKQTNADVELKNAQAIKAMKEAGYTQKQIDFYIAHGVFPGATISGGALGANVSVPVGYNNPHGDKPKSWAGTAWEWAKNRAKTYTK